MKATLLLYLFIFSTYNCFGQTTLFQQDFSAGTPLSQYISSSPSANQFNGIAGPSAAIVNGTLQFDRQVNGTTGHFSRNTDFSPTPTSLYIQFDFEVTSPTSASGNSALLFYVGSAFGNGVGNPSNAETYARFGINFTNNGHEFSVRYIPVGGTGSFNSATYTGKQTITFVLNNTGQTITYLKPGGGTQSLANDMFDLWVSSTKVISAQPVLTPTQTMTDFKLRVDDDIYAATFQFDNFLIRDVTGSLPVTLTHFSGKAQGARIDLNWTTATEYNSDLFIVERSTDAQEFSPIGSVRAMGESDNQRTYGFSDQSPAAGVNYYRLRQTDRDGTTTLSKLVAVSYEPNQPALVLLTNPTGTDGIRVRPYALEAPAYSLCSLTGQQIELATHLQSDGSFWLKPVGTLPVGVYLLTASTGTIRLTRRVLVN